MLTVLFVVFCATSAAAQDDILTKAREAATSGHRPEALSMLEARLAAAPKDVDARLLYGLVLSWEGRYDDARTALQQVLTQAPDYTDARVALMNVEYWSGHSLEAREQADQILARHPDNTTARAVRERLDAAARAWWIKTDYTFDRFNDGRKSWHETTLSLTRQTPVGSVIVRGSYAERFGENDQMIEAEFYPRLRPGTYAFISVGGSPDHSVYPQVRYLFDLYQSVGHGFEVSGGARFMDFGSVTQIYLGTVTKYVGNWMLTAKVFRVPAENRLDSTTWHGGFRRYYGSDGTSYVGFNYSHGLSREEVYSLTDLVQLHADTVRGEFDHLLGARFRLSGSAATSHQERTVASPLWQTTLSAGLAVHF